MQCVCFTYLLCLFLVRCLKCKNNSNTFDPLMDIMLDIKVKLLNILNDNYLCICIIMIQLHFRSFSNNITISKITKI